MPPNAIDDGSSRPASAISKSGQELPDQPQQSQSLVRSYPTRLSNLKVWSGAIRPASAISKSGQELPDRPQQSLDPVKTLNGSYSPHHGRRLHAQMS
ncbi:hypothetical protein DPMN_017767 [Dreissena polymorpha]|uniref:Uncharacterized protein n=1 Tax=Dreissena polymorpha TaxID=45954 RepID=A0A9D4NH52_DREPO|nr:hypothetical protein DPMN_017767 [Dreissena polymorpha]